MCDTMCLSYLSQKHVQSAWPFILYLLTNQNPQAVWLKHWSPDGDASPPELAGLDVSQDASFGYKY